jgi:hypothetical protein
MATGAGLAEWEQTHGKKKAKCVLTSTGLLMEGLRFVSYNSGGSLATSTASHSGVRATMRLKSLVSAHFGLSLIVLAIFLRPASAGFRPSFSLEYSSWHATHIALVKITSKPGVFIVVESWKGELQPGDAIAVPELKPVPGAMPISLYPRSTDFFARDNSGTIEQIPAQPVGARMVVFLKNHDGRDSRPSSSTNPREAWRSADLFNEMKASVVWIDGGLLYRFQQVVNPGPSHSVGYFSPQDETPRKGD